MAIFEDFWRLLEIFGDFSHGISESYREFSRFFEIFEDFWIVLGNFQGVSENLGEF